MLWIQNITVLTKASAGGRALLGDRGGTAHGSSLMFDRWPAMLVAAVLPVLVITRPAWWWPRVLLEGVGRRTAHLRY